MNAVIAWIVTLLVIVIGIIVALFAWYVKESKEEREKLVNALIAKDATELRDLEYVAKLPKQTKPQELDLVPFEQMNEEQFDEHIEKELRDQNA